MPFIRVCVLTRGLLLLLPLHTARSPRPPCQPTGPTNSPTLPPACIYPPTNHLCPQFTVCVISPSLPTPPQHAPKPLRREPEDSDADKDTHRRCPYSGHARLSPRLRAPAEGDEPRQYSTPRARASAMGPRRAQYRERHGTYL